MVNFLKKALLAFIKEGTKEILDSEYRNKKVLRYVRALGVILMLFFIFIFIVVIKLS